MYDEMPPELVLDEPPWSDEELDIATGPGASAAEVERFAQIELVGTEQAQWAMATLARLTRLRDELKAQADAWHARIDAWYASADHPLAGRAAFIDDRLQRYGLAVRERSHVATVSLPSGAVQTRKRGEHVVSDDDDVVVAFLHGLLDSGEITRLEFDDAVKTTESLRISELRKLVRIVTVGENQLVLFGDDQVVPGVHVEAEAVTATVKPETQGMIQ